MAGFSVAEWKKIRSELDRNAEKYGLPPRRDGSVLFASFNIRKLGEVKKRSKDTWDFLAHVLNRFDLVAVQES